MQYDDVTTNPIWQTDAIFKKFYLYISAAVHPISMTFGEGMQILIPRMVA